VTSSDPAALRRPVPGAAFEIKIFRCLLAAFLAITATAGFAQDAGSALEISKRLYRMFSEHLVGTRALYPLGATANGLREFDGQFVNDLTEEYREAHRRYCRSGLEKLQAFDRARLSASDQLSHDVFRRNQERCLDRLDQELHLLPLDQGGGGPLDILPVWASGKGPQPFRNVTDYENFLKRLAGFPGWIDAAIANMRAGMKRGIVYPRPTMQRALRQLSPMVVEDATRSPFYQPIHNLPEEIQGEDRRRLAAAYEELIRTQIVPAYRRLRDFVSFEYLVATHDTSGLAGIPGGDKLYAYYVRAFTTLGLGPREIADLGKREMARAREKMERLKEASGFRGELKDWVAQVAKKQERHATADEALAGYRALHDRVHPQLGKLFGTLPKAPYEIQRTDVEREDTQPSLYRRGTRDRPATVFINMRAARRGSVGVSERLFLHEAVPGHHLQIAIAQESRDLPGFRRTGSWLAFNEGWAVYAEELGHELGLYRDLYQHLAILNADLSRAARLVVDVGLHSDRWTFGQAIQFLRDNTLDAYFSPGSDGGLASAVERQMARPAFHLAYKMGQLKFLELRERAQARLGAKFDVRAFHDELLKDGALPLDILEEKMARWLAAQGR
jgi:uncharacterized protein (DUF885 family)